MQKVGCFLGKYKSTTVFLSFLQTEMDEEQMDIVDANQPQADSSIMINKSWKHPTAAKQVIIQRDAVGNNSTWLACASAWNSLLSAVKLVLKWLYIGIEWPKDINSEAFARKAVTASDSTCPADGVSLALMSTLLLIPDSFCAGMKIIPDRASCSHIKTVISFRRDFCNGAKLRRADP